MDKARPHIRPSPPRKKKPEGRPPARITPARLATFQILERMVNGKAHSDDLLYGPALDALSQEDRNLTTTLVMGVLRWQIALDARIQPLLQRPDLVLADPVRLALRIGAFQLLHLDRIPAHAAINESVELVRAGGHPHAAGMVNAILRKLGTTPAPGKRLHESIPALAERLGHPSWLVERWVKHYGREAALAICEFDQHEPACGVLFAEGSQTGDAPVMPQMDTGSRLVAEITAASMPGAKRIWDCCAAPGGKTLILAHRHPQAELLATDANPRRLRGLAERLRREAPEAHTTTLVSEAQELPEEQGQFDLILCDVPCSGTGTLARNPEIRHHLRPSDLARQAERQRSILSSALQRLAPGGHLIYSTCSLEPEENEAVADALVEESRGKFLRLPVASSVDRLREHGILVAGADLTQFLHGDSLRTLPGYGFEGDGFFATVLAHA